MASFISQFVFKNKFWNDLVHFKNSRKVIMQLIIEDMFWAAEIGSTYHCVGEGTFIHKCAQYFIKKN